MLHVKVRGERFYVVRHGGGPPALVLHGGPGLGHTYMRGLDHLGLLVQLIYYDQRGAGLSTDADLTGMTNEGHADDSERLRRVLGLDEVLFIGHSHGGSVALEYALKYPDTVAGLVLISSVGSYAYPMTRPDEYLSRLGPAQREVLAKPVETDADAHRNRLARLPLTVADPSRAADVQAAFEGGRYTVAAARAAEEAGDDWSVVDRLHAVAARALVVGGQQDWITPPEQVERLAASLPRAELVLLGDCGHFPWIEQPDAFFDAVGRFLQR